MRRRASGAASSRRSSRCSRSRQPHFEQRASVRIVRCADGAAVRLDDRLHDREPESRVPPLLGGTIGEEAIEQPAEVFLGDAGTAVANAYEDAAIVAAGGYEHFGDLLRVRCGSLDSL